MLRLLYTFQESLFTQAFSRSKVNKRAASATHVVVLRGQANREARMSRILFSSKRFW